MCARSCFFVFTRFWMFACGACSLRHNRRPNPLIFQRRSQYTQYRLCLRCRTLDERCCCCRFPSPVFSLLQLTQIELFFLLSVIILKENAPLHSLSVAISRPHCIVSSTPMTRKNKIKKNRKEGMKGCALCNSHIVHVQSDRCFILTLFDFIQANSPPLET